MEPLLITSVCIQPLLEHEVNIVILVDKNILSVVLECFTPIDCVLVMH